MVLEKAEEPEIKLPTSAGLSKKQENSRPLSPWGPLDFLSTCLGNDSLIDYPKAFDGVDHKKLENSERDGNTRPLTCLLRNLYAGQEATVRTRHRTDWFQIGKGVRQGCILSPCLFNLYAEYVMRNARLEETQAGIKIAGRNINNHRYADDTTFWQKVKRN